MKMKCNNINYRKGYIEVISNIHDDCINLEVTTIHPDIDISNIELTDPEFPDNAVMSNTEIEINIEEAKQLIEFLKSSISRVRELKVKDD